MPRRISIVLAADQATVRQALRRLLESQPDCEVVAEAAGSEEAIRQVGELEPDVLVLDLSMPGKTSLEAISVLEETSPATKILVLEEELAQAVRGAAGRRSPGPDLSERETDVLRLIALGHTNAEIAEKLYLSVRTVETHRASVQRKLGVHSRAELVRSALSRGLLDA